MITNQSTLIETIDKLNEQMKSKISLGDTTLSLYDWLNIPDSALRAGFQAAIIPSQSDQLFFVEHLNLYLSYLKGYTKNLDKIKNIIKKLNELSITTQYDEDKVELMNDGKEQSRLEIECIHRQQAALESFKHALSLSKLLWNECIVSDGNHQLNISLSSLAGESGCSISAQKGKEIMEDVESRLAELTKQNESNRLKLNFKKHGLIPNEQDNLIQDFMQHQESLFSDLNVIFSRVLPDIIGYNGISQATFYAKEFNQAVEKWRMEEEEIKYDLQALKQIKYLPVPPLWSPMEEHQVCKMKKVGAMVSQWFEKKSNTSKSEVKIQKRTVENSISALVSPRYFDKNRKTDDATPLKSCSSFIQSFDGSKKDAFLNQPLIAEESRVVQSQDSFSSFSWSFFSKQTINTNTLGEEEAKQAAILKALHPLSPPTPGEKESYQHLIAVVASLKGAAFKELKEDVKKIVDEPEKEALSVSCVSGNIFN